ncbi:TIGR02171 family lipoprotein [Fibrobacter sp.]|uniref:TIGR02171 family lipoprotein n=1 Tax=Fibrobacter sp. TaxID=35828 RepID=UPI00388D0DEE
MMSVLFVLLAFLFCACSNSENLSVSGQDAPVEVSEDSLSGMLRIKAMGATAILGTNSENARVIEHPSMRVKFEYDYSLGVHEVTCGEFDSLMKPATGLALNCVQDSLPATNVTYYDAVLFANERSKAEGFDTAYTYTSASIDAEGHCTNLEGFAYHPEVNAYRLPTEAEWVLAATWNWNPQNGWTAENSDYKLHQVCGKVDSLAKSNELCDMAGNAMEWVNDWLGNFRDTTLENYVGAPDGGALGQRIVKGGSYRNVAESVNLFSRGDVYTVTSSTRADYVGFRLAFGSIPDAVWMGDDGRANSSRIIPLANSATIRSLVGTYKAKLAFRNDLSGNLAFIDYSSGIISVVEIGDSIEVYHPEISPDGKRVAFCTGLEGVSGKSELYVRDLNAEGSNLVKLKVESAAIPRWHVLENGDTVIVYVTDAGNNKEESAFKSTSTWQVKFSNGKFGTPQKLFDGAYHGGISDDNTLAVTGARLLRARIAKEGSTLTGKARDTVWYKNGEDAEQACNASLAKDGSKRTLFLDFGGKTGRSFVGKSYATHERLLIADSTGKLLQSVAAPAGHTFDHSEWAGGAENKVVATLVNSNGVHQRIVLVDLFDSSITDLLQGDEIWHPNLWTQSYSMNNESGWNLDSIGEYRGNTNQTSNLLYEKMPMLWEFRDSAEVVGLGNSHMWTGFDPHFIKRNAVNLGVVPCDMHCIEYLFSHYIVNHYGKLKYLVVSLDFDLWYNEDPERDISISMGDALGFRYDINHDFWPQGVDESFVDLVRQKAVAESEGQIERLGCLASEFTGGWVNLETGLAEIIDDSTWSDNANTYKSNIAALENVISLAQSLDIVVVGVIFPISPAYAESGAYGRHGMRRSHAEKIVGYLNSLDDVHSHFVLMDENKMGEHDYPNDMALDYDHLNKRGAEQISRRIDSLLNSLE